jgi:hypothetical protein
MIKKSLKSKRSKSHTWAPLKEQLLEMVFSIEDEKLEFLDFFI